MGRGRVEGVWREGGPLEPEFNQYDASLGVLREGQEGLGQLAVIPSNGSLVWIPSSTYLVWGQRDAGREGEEPAAVSQPGAPVTDLLCPPASLGSCLQWELLLRLVHQFLSLQNFAFQDIPYLLQLVRAGFWCLPPCSLPRLCWEQH